MQVALAADSSYRFEVNYLGFPPPPDNEYDIYIDMNMGVMFMAKPCLNHQLAMKNIPAI